MYQTYLLGIADALASSQDRPLMGSNLQGEIEVDVKEQKR